MVSEDINPENLPPTEDASESMVPGRFEIS